MLDFSDSPIIAATRFEDEFISALSSPAQFIFLLNANILTLKDYIKQAKSFGKTIFVHCDLAEGIGKDSSGIGFISKIGADGIISTRGNMIKQAKEWQLKTVQRFFIVDSHAIDTAVESTKYSCPDLIEVMPGVVPKIIKTFNHKTDIPIIAGGLIETKHEIISAIEAGASAISTAKSELWYK